MNSRRVMAGASPRASAGGSARLGNWIVRRRRRVLLFWLAVALIGVAGASHVTSRLSSAQTLPGLASYDTSQRIHRIYGTGGVDAPVALTIVLPSDTKEQSTAGQAELSKAIASLQADRQLRIASFLNTGNPRLVGEGGRAALVLAFGSDTEPSASALAARVRPALPLGATVSGTSFQDLQSGSSSGLGVLAETVVGGIGALIVLMIVFGSVLALVPLVVAIVSILTTLLLIGTVTTVASVSVLVEYLVALIGLGIAIDYSLLMVTRWREELATGKTNEEAVIAAFAQAGRAVGFSGLTVGVGLLTLVTLPIAFVRSLGYAGILIPLVSVLVTVSLLPALLATVGPRLEWPHRRRPAGASRAWTAWTRGVVRHRVAAAVTATALLGLLVFTAFDIRVGQVVPASLSPSGSAAAGLATLNRAGFPTGAMDPVEVLLPPAGSPATVTDGSPAAVTDGSPATATDGSPAAVTLTHALAALRGVYTVVAPASPAWHRDGTNLIDVLPDSPTSFGGNAALVGAVQRQLATAAPGAAETGTSPVEYDLVHAIYGRTLIVLSLVGLATLLILSVAFRSIIVAIKALVLNVLSIGATIGALVLVWQRGYGSHAIWGISTTGAVIDFVPLIVFAFLFGLSMDYEVFIVSRIKEAHDSGSPADEAIVAGISRTGRLVTSAAAVLVLAFAALSAGPQVSLKMFATGLAFGIFIDATVVRCLLVPAALSLLGERAWWLPGRLRVAQAVPADVVP